MGNLQERELNIEITHNISFFQQQARNDHKRFQCFPCIKGTRDAYKQSLHIQIHTNFLHNIFSQVFTLPSSQPAELTRHIASNQMSYKKCFLVNLLYMLYILLNGFDSPNRQETREHSKHPIKSYYTSSPVTIRQKPQCIKIFT